MRFRKIIFLICMLTCALLVAFNASAMRAARAGFDVWLNSLMPALLPFFICTSLLRATGLLSAATPFGLVVLGFISGAPSGAKLCGEVYGYEEAPTPLCAALNMISPMFIYGSFATSIIGISKIAMPIILAQLIALGACIPFALRYTSRVKAENTKPLIEQPFSTALFSAISSSMLALLNICATVILFMVLLELLSATGILTILAYPFAWLLGFLGAPKGYAEALLTGFVEVTNGCKALSALDLPVRTVAASAAFFFSFGGICVMAQSSGFARIDVKSYLLRKLAQGLIAAAAAHLLTPLFVSDAATVFEPFAQELAVNNALSSAMIFGASLLGVATVALWSAAAERKRRKQRPGRV
jgi:spore maturation protein SpmB